MTGLSKVIEFFLIMAFWSLCLLVGARLMSIWIFSPFDITNIEPKPLALGLAGAFLIIVAIMATKR